MEIYDVYQRYIQQQMDKLETLGYSKSWALAEGRYLMKPLVEDIISKDAAEPINEEILTQRMAKVRCMVVEDNGIRSIVSAETVHEMPEINIFESKMTQAAEYLLKEIKSEATLNDLIGVVCADDNFLNGVKNIVCNYEANNILHQYAISNKEVSTILISHKQRRIKLTYSLKKDIWYEFVLRNRRYSSLLYIPKNEFIIDGLESEIGVKTYRGIYIRSDVPIYTYILKMIGVFLKEETDENRLLLEIFLSTIFDTDILERIYSPDVDANRMFRHMTENGFVRVSDELQKKMWEKVDSEEFVQIVLRQNYSLYSIHNWSRKEEEL
ncbi:hypothetical protein NSB25_28095 [Acetatifactor muris]|uniref:Uncharacterized protein n=1 Tax=Acetatifactor muris TaxID=879566 RepID=A0A2K4ZQ90_9FIRM|nr:hypothetical protein [Acetatifactor muris]MCR2051083.1 hypothetical protein [Acetatifactor muris]SOY32627.1 hypothetical protein AMURIS_05392 [Acetatifactor muris]